MDNKEASEKYKVTEWERYAGTSYSFKKQGFVVDELRIKDKNIKFILSDQEDFARWVYYLLIKDECINKYNDRCVLSVSLKLL